MCQQQKPYNCIVPPHILRAMAESKDKQVRDAALRTMMASSRIRGQREIVGRVRAAMLAPAPGKKSRSIHDAQHQFLNDFDLPGKLVREEGQPASQDRAVNEAYDGLGATYDFYSKTVGRNSIDDRGSRLVATVHFDQDFNNAFWNGRQMVFGDGDGTIFVGFTRSLDVIGHELTHGVTEFTAGLEYHKQSGALNESFSDVFGSLVKQFALKQNVDQADWLIGSEILAPGVNGVALRSMKDPGSAFDDDRLGGKDPQPKHMSGFLNLPDNEDNDFGGVHINSGIPNFAFYLVARELGGNAWEQAGLIWYRSLLQLFEKAQFQDCANITTQVAGTLFGTDSKQQKAVKSAWSKVGINVEVPEIVGAGAGKLASYGSNGNDLKRQLEIVSQSLGQLAASL
jgi:Zinc metalloprotease (elastase)